MDEIKVFVPYTDVMELKKAADNLENVKAILTTEFPDDTCQVIALKAILGIVDEVEEPDDPVDPGIGEPTDPSDPVDPDPTDPPTDPGSTP